MARNNIIEIDTLSYPVVFGEEPWDRTREFIKPFQSAGGVFILSDRNTFQNCYPVLLKNLPELALNPVFTIEPGEGSKVLPVLGQIWNWLMTSGAGKDSLLINLGGGVISDLGGFAAATFKRGIPFMNIPTSLIGQADAAIGGKTGININGVKNQAGIFTNPHAVVIFPGFLESLPVLHFRSGYAEIIKAALLSGGELWKAVKSMTDIKLPDVNKLIMYAVEFKCNIVVEDPHEKSRRKVLNFGHTIGHALESFYNRPGKEGLLHGDAIAAGIICEAFLSAQTKGLPRNELQEIVSLIRSSYNPVLVPDFEEMQDILYQDKKRTFEGLNFSLLESIGKPAINCIADKSAVLGSFMFLNEMIKP